jgi:hypothetical protein
VSRFRIGMVHVRRVQTDLRFAAANGGSRFAWFDKDSQRDVDAIRSAFIIVFDRLITAMPGEPWAKTAEMKERFRVG